MEALLRALNRNGGRYIIDTGCGRFRHPALADALGVWRTHAGSSGIPRCRDLGPQVMRTFLKKIALFELVERFPGVFDYRARLTGPEFSAAYTEMTGRFFDEAVNGKYLLRFRLLADAALATRKPFRCLCVPEASKHANAILEFLLAPLLDDSDEVKQILFVGNFERGRDWASVEAEERNVPVPAASC